MEEAITRDPEVMHGTPVFRGTRVPVQTLFDYIENGESLHEFLEGFPTISCELAVHVLDERVDQKLRLMFAEHDCQTAAYAKLAGLKNGVLLAAAEAADFDPHPCAPTNRLADLKRLVPAALLRSFPSDRRIPSDLLR